MDEPDLDVAVDLFHQALDAQPDSEVFHSRGGGGENGWSETTDGNTGQIVYALLQAGWMPPSRP